MITQVPTIRKEVEQCIQWFRNNPSDTRLRNHALHKKLADKWAFSVTDDIRIVYERVGTNAVRFLAIGGHTMVYRLPATPSTRSLQATG
ncbi:hypothetical protein HY950_02595 [Candidatus Gottesmanbacteria bacterium]|nr:hypothetical protein [Candidatus Gottesmanbacteria bacterium]